MRKYVCDLCGEESNHRDFAIPIAATFIDGEPCDLMPIHMNLCKKCGGKIYKTVAGIVDNNKLDELNRKALKKNKNDDLDWDVF